MGEPTGHAELATGARDVLRRNGFRPLVVCDDGARGVPGRSPYDRLISTASVGVSGLPAAWLDQVSTGGVLLAPWGGDYHPGGLVRLTKAADGSASGPVVGGVSFMRLRAQRAQFGHAGRLSGLIDAAVDAREGTTPGTTTEVATNVEAAFAAGLRLRGVQKSIARTGQDEREILLYDPDSDSAATVRTSAKFTVGGEHPVRQIGRRSLWTDAVAAHRWWNQLGRPDRTRFGLTVRPDGRHVLRIDGEVVALRGR